MLESQICDNAPTYYNGFRTPAKRCYLITKDKQQIPAVELILPAGTRVYLQNKDNRAWRFVTIQRGLHTSAFQDVKKIQEKDFEYASYEKVLPMTQ